MKSVLWSISCLLPLVAAALDYAVQIDNDQVCVVKWKLYPHEVVPPHRDVLPTVVVALQGGVITRHEADGSFTEVDLPTGVAVLRPVDPVGELHSSINNSDDPIEGISIMLKPQ